MRDHTLRVLRQKRDELHKLKAERWKEHLSAREDLRKVKGLLESAERINAALDRASGPDRAELMTIAASYPEVEELKKRREVARAQIESTAQAHRAVRLAFQKAVDKFNRRLEHCRMVKRDFGHLLVAHFPRTQDEVVTTLRHNALHVYWGGQYHPLGPGHGHYKFQQGKLVYRRDPIKAGP